MKPLCDHPRRVCEYSLSICTGNAIRDYFDSHSKLSKLKLSKYDDDTESGLEEIKAEFCTKVGSSCLEVASFCTEGPYDFCPLIANLCKTAGVLCADSIGCGFSSGICNYARELRRYLYKIYKLKME